MIMLAVVVLWISVGALLVKEEEKRKRQNRKRRRRQTKVYNYCICEEDCIERKSA